jgi:hypothetical protein
MSKQVASRAETATKKDRGILLLALMLERSSKDVQRISDAQLIDLTSHNTEIIMDFGSLRDRLDDYGWTLVELEGELEGSVCIRTSTLSKAIDQVDPTKVGEEIRQIRDEEFDFRATRRAYMKRLEGGHPIEEK